MIWPVEVRQVDVEPNLDQSFPRDAPGATRRAAERRCVAGRGLVAAVFRNEVDACAAEAATIAARHRDDPVGALRAWLYRYMDFILTKRGLAPALHSGDPAFAGLHEYFDERLGPALTALLEEAARASEIRVELSAHTLLHAVRILCVPDDDGSVAHARPVVDLFIDGLRSRDARPQ